MAILLNKSIDNEESAKLLMDNEYYSSSVHCSYYRCIQYMRHFLFNFLKIDEDKFDNSSEIKSNGSHSHLISTVKNEILELRRSHNYSNTFNQLEFSTNFYNFKKLRKKADYEQKIIFESDSLEAIKKANYFIDNIKIHTSK